ncbi:MAG: hydroxylamine reductase [Candidatus Bathyarchaeota archaeon]|nr:hydroxylamine reductase [Candidatus Bathyarchaeota archaeon]MCX8177665.1 hydroxylamine reductase [Candidatus Bathyarchaeota archaeon]MDW8193920.1 hydroxylamine reductase [Nitrososphaerota archaeon]
MFCYQCEQTAKGRGCTVVGVCGKEAEVSALQDLLIYTLTGLSQVIGEARKAGVYVEHAGFFLCEALFSTLTNVNFHPDRIVNYIHQAVAYRERLREKIREAGGNVDIPGPACLEVAESKEGLLRQARQYAVMVPPETGPEADLFGLKSLLTFGVKGVAAYTYHAYRLGKKDDRVFKFIEEALTATLNERLGINDFLDLALKCGEINIRAMELLDAAHTENYGHPAPTEVPLGVKKGKAILISGHDLKDLEELLKQTQGRGIYVYTHGEMLPAHAYPKLKAYSHFYGHYGTAWQNQRREFAEFPGAILMTTNCLQIPLESYKANIFTTGPVGAPGVTHIYNGDFAPVIKRALELPGFRRDLCGKTVKVGFARNAVLSIASKIVKLVREGKITHFFLVGGCDGAKPGRSYYPEFVEKTPGDTVVLTLACGKFRFFDKELGEVEGVPRLLDIGQCNDAYSAIKIAQALAEAFNVNVNELPLSLVLSWYEQKAVAILLSLLHLGIKNIRLGPSLPAFITPNTLKVLVEKFNVMPIKTPEEDLRAILG